MDRKIYLKLILYLIISSIIYMLSYNYISKEEKKQLNEKYLNTSLNMKKNLSTLIEDKKNATLAMAISTAKNKNIIDAFMKKDKSHIKLDTFSLELKKNTRFKNVWFQLLDKKGISIYRSWTKNTNDSLIFRPDVKLVLKEKSILSSISVGRYDMTFKSMVPIFKNDHFLGIFEVITHFNSIATILKKDKIDSIILAHKKYKEKITHPFTKKFLDDYYVANLNAKESLIKLIKENGIEELLKVKDYKVLNDNILTTFKIVQFQNKIIGYILLSKNIKDIDTKAIKTLKNTLLSYVVFSIILLGFLFAAISYYLNIINMKKLNLGLKEKIKQIRIQKKKSQTILDSQKNIIIITDGVELQNSNLELLNFFEKYSSLQEFKKDYRCICETFIDMNDETYVIEKEYDNKNWAEYILANPNKKFKAAILKKNKIHHFTLNVNLTQFENEEMPFIVVTLTDITEEIEKNKKLKNLNDNLEIIVNKKTKELRKLNESLENKIQEEILKSKNKDRILFQQNKMASMGEMLSNIAHQWRQPLSSISTAASSLKLKKELDILEEKELDYLCSFILKNTQYLSHTIEDFKNFFKQDKKKINFSIKEAFLEDLSLLKDRLNYNKIEVILNINDDVTIYGYKNEFQQSILNILNNCLDAFDNKIIETKKIIIVDFKDNILTIKDSAGGINENIINKIFEPYFTTKHQSQGTGIGLYMTQEILTKHMNCNLSVENIEFKEKDEIYYGACFKIIFNI